MKKFAKYFEILKTSFLSSTSYRGDAFSSLFFLVLIMFIFFSLWKASFLKDGQSLISGFTFSKMLWYIALTEALMLSGSRLRLRIDEEIRSGNVSNFLTKPFYYPLFLAFDSIGSSLFKFFTKLPVAILIVFVLTLKFEGSVYGLLSYLVLGFLGLFLDAFIVILIGLLAFFIEDTQPVYWIYNKMLFTIGGLLVPIDLMPQFFRTISLYLPFKFILYNPSYSFVNFSFNFFLSGLFGVLIAICIVFALIMSIFHLAGRRLSINGG